MGDLSRVREKIRANFPKEDQTQSRREIRWARETTNSIVSSCGTYRISKMEDPDNPGLCGFRLDLCATPASASKFIVGPVLLMRDAKEAADRHRNGEPLQACLT